MAGNIASSVIESSLLQKDGRSWVHEIHTDLVGLKYDHVYLADAALDHNAALAAYAVILAANLAAAEIASNIAAVTTIGSLASPTFVYSIVADNVAALRAAYLIATQAQAIMIGDFLSSLTNVQLENAFGLTLPQVTTLRTNKLTPAATAATTIRAAVGQ